MKKIGLIIGILLCFSMTVLCFGSDISITVDGNVLETDTPAQIVDGRTLVPLRAIFEAIGAEVGWNSEEKSVTAIKDGTSIYMKIDEKTFTVNGDEKTLDVPAAIIDGRTMVPARAVSESLGCSVEWNAATKTVAVSTKSEDNTEQTTAETTKERVTEVTTEAIKYSTVYKSGTYKVGEDMPFGKYVFFAEGDKIGKIVMIQPEYIKTDHDSKFENVLTHEAVGAKSDKDAQTKTIDDKSIYINDFEVLTMGKRKESDGSKEHEKNAFVVDFSSIATEKTGLGNSAYISQSKPVYFKELRLENCYAVPSEEVEKMEPGYNGIYKVGTDFSPGDYGFVRAAGCDFAYIKIGGVSSRRTSDIYNPVINRFTGFNSVKTDLPIYPIVVNSPYYFTFKEGNYIRVVNCNITKNKITYIQHRATTPKEKINMDFSKVSDELKSKVKEDIKPITTNGVASKETIEKIKGEWKKLAKTDEDKRYCEIISDVADKYGILKFDIIPYVPYENYYATVGKQVVIKEGLNFQNENYLKEVSAKKDALSGFSKKASEITDAKSFNELAEINCKLNDYIILLNNH